jgi:protein O-GlcNAc transferase
MAVSEVSTSPGPLQHALGLLQQGRLAQADALCRRVLNARPREFHALHMLGIIALQRSELTEAERWLDAAIASRPDQPHAHSNLSAVLTALNRPREALEQADLALQLDPNFAQAWTNRANALCKLQRPKEALAGYERGVHLAPWLFDAHFGRGNLLLRSGQYGAAIDSYDRALQIDPDHLEALNDRGITLLNLHRTEEALAMFDRAVRLSPRHADAFNHRGSALRRLRRPEEALESYRQALRLQPNRADILSNAANVLLGLELLDEALGCSNQALALEPDLADALNIQATVLRDLGRHEDAAQAYARLLTLTPEFDYAIGNCVMARAHGCDWSDRAGQVSAIVESVANDQRACLPFSFLSLSHCAADQLRCARTFAADRCPPAPPRAMDVKRHHDRIRVAYVSGDFGEHPVSYLLAGVFERHDPSRFETLAISLRPQQQSVMGQRVRHAFARFIDVSGRGSSEVRGLLAELEIDIAVDLSGFTAGMRPEIFAHRAAPIQVNYLGFPGTMGADFMDYLIADEFVVPRNMQAHYSEKIVYLPDCFQCFDDRRPSTAAAPVRNAVGLADDAFVFCSFNNSYKINPALFDVWMRLLRRTPASVLWLLGARESVRRNLRREAARRGVPADRLVFAGRCPYGEHLARLPLADLFLDCLPFNGGATASDALSMGLPVLTATGEAFSSRMAGSLLTAAGVPELIADGLGDYEAKALAWAQRPEELRSLKRRLAANRSESPLFATDVFRRHLEAAYEFMWNRHGQGLPPAAFAVDRLP